LVQEELPGGQPDAPHILIVAAGARERALVQEELASALAPETRFAQAGNVWEVLQQAPQSGVVMLAGDLPDIGARTLMRLLGRRQPWLPVVVMDAPGV
jgi:CheY-like chemotaxis protein